MSYTKLFASIVTSTIWSEDDKTRIVWITMLAIADKNGEIQASIPGLGRIAGVSTEDTEKAINKFLSPDPYSRTPDDEGRRIEKIEGGWALLNHAKYRLMASKEDQKSAVAKRVARHRDQKKRNGHVTLCNSNVTLGNGEVTQTVVIAEAEAEADTKKEESRLFSLVSSPEKKPFSPKTKTGNSNPKGTLEEVCAFCESLNLPASDGTSMFWKWEGSGWLNSGKPIKNWQAVIRQWKSSSWLPSQKNPTANGGSRPISETFRNSTPSGSRELFD